jgi:hypothetical protein
MIIVKNFISLEEYPYDGDIDIVHAHKVARTCLGFQPGVRDFRRYVVQRLHHGSFFADEAWGRTCFATCPFHGVQSGSLRDFNPSFPKH